MATRHKVKTQVGLDIGSFSIKAVELTETIEGRFELSNYGIERMNSSNPAESIKKVVATAGISTKQPVVISVSGPSVVVRYIELPKMAKDELKKAIRFEAEKHIPYKVDDVIIDCDILEDLPDGKMRVLLAAAKKDLINSKLKMAQEAGFVVSAIDIDALALMNTFLLTDTQDNEIPVALIDIGAKTTNVNIIKNRLSYFMRDIQVAGDDLTKKLAEKLGVTPAEAENLKINMKERQDEVYEAMSGVLDNLTDELRLSFDYYENRYAKTVNKIYISGGTSNLDKIDKILTDALGIQIIKWDSAKVLVPGSNVSAANLSKDVPSLGVSIGLATRKD